MLCAHVTVNCLSSCLRVLKKGTIPQMAGTELIHHILWCDLCGLKGWCLSKWLWNMPRAKKHPPLKLVWTTYSFLSSGSIAGDKILWWVNVFGYFIINEINFYLSSYFACHPRKGRQPLPACRLLVVQRKREGRTKETKVYFWVLYSWIMRRIICFIQEIRQQIPLLENF